MPHPLICAIVRIKEPRLPFLRQCFLVYSETMVLRGNEATLGSYLNAGLVLAAMAILQLERISAGSQEPAVDVRDRFQGWEYLFLAPCEGPLKHRRTFWDLRVR